MEAQSMATSDKLEASAPAIGRVEGPLGHAAHPNEMDLRRIARALAARERYRYVWPHVSPAERGYRISSPCCSRRVDPQGGEIDIDWIEHVRSSGRWRLHRRDHAAAGPRMFRESPASALPLGCPRSGW